MSELLPKKTMLITGATGLIGRELSLSLLKRGWRLVVLGRSSEEVFRSNFTLPCQYFQWADPTHSPPPQAALNVDCVLNLMGEPIADRRWTVEQKVRLRESRISSTRNLVASLRKFNPTLETFVSGSAIGYYGDGGNEIISESSPPASDFLGSLCKDWEREAQMAPGRCVLIRTGVVLSNAGGALEKMLPLFERGLGSRLSGGNQWMSWIHIRDLINIFLHVIEDADCRGPYNAVAPEPVTNTYFTDHLAGQLKVGVFLSVPKIVLGLVMGERSQILLTSQRVKPAALESQGFQFQFRTLDHALKELFAWKESRHDRLFQSFQWVPRSRESVFPFFAEVNNLEILTPDFLNFHILKKSAEPIQSGSEIDYKLKIHGFPVKWRTRICDWQPERQFRDIQLKGPYKKWDHTHTFEDLAEGTLLIDKVIYRLPLSGFGGNLLSAVIKNDIKKIFSFRRKKIREIFGESSARKKIPSGQEV